MGKTWLVVVGILQVVAGIAWAGWMVLTREGLELYLGLVPSVFLVLGAVAPILGARLIAQREELAGELQRIKTLSRLDAKKESLKERVEHFGMLKDWGLITEEEFQQRRRALLGLEEPAVTGPEADEAEPTPAKAPVGAAGKLTVVPMTPRRDPQTSFRPKRPRTPRTKAESGK